MDISEILLYFEVKDANFQINKWLGVGFGSGSGSGSKSAGSGITDPTGSGFSPLPEIMDFELKNQSYYQIMILQWQMCIPLFIRNAIKLCF